MGALLLCTFFTLSFRIIYLERPCSTFQYFKSFEKDYATSTDKQNEWWRQSKNAGGGGAIAAKVPTVSGVEEF